MDKVVESEQGNEGAFQGERRKIIQPSSLNDPKLVKLKEVLIEWINSTLKPDHVVIQSLEEDIYDGLVLHHLLDRLGGVHLVAEEIAVTSAAQICKLELILKALNQELGFSAEADSAAKWNAKREFEDVTSGWRNVINLQNNKVLIALNRGLAVCMSVIHSRDLLATLHLLVAMVKRYQPELPLPQNISVEVILLEVNRGGIKSDKQIEYITMQSDTEGCKNDDPIDELLKLDAHKIDTVKKALLHFINKNMSPLRLQVSDIEKQFADGVILLLLIGELEGFFIPLYEFYLSPASHSEMLHNVTLALDLLNDREIQVQNVDPEDIVSQDVPATLKVLYALFKKHKNK